MESSKYQLIARLCIEKYQRLPKTGKPLDNQWTTLAGLICEQSDQFNLIALTTGTKCVTGSLSTFPNVIVDCHAEILTKRAFKRWLSDYLIKNSADSLEQLRWHLFISQLPCGTIDRYQGPCKQDSDHGVHRKPGRGEPCPESSCIDKLLKWNYLGLQGSRLIALTRKPIHLSSLIIGNCSELPEFDCDKLKQALTLPESGLNLSEPFNELNQIEFYFAENIKTSPFIRSNSFQACPSAIVYWKENGDQCEIVVDGLKQGVNRKSASTNQLRLSRYGLMNKFHQLIETHDHDDSLSKLYHETWNQLKSNYTRFKGWKTKSS